jgi:hypothetical protein
LDPGEGAFPKQLYTDPGQSVNAQFAQYSSNVQFAGLFFQCHSSIGSIQVMQISNLVSLDGISMHLKNDI